MYGLINKAIRGLVVEQFGKEAWDRIRQRAEIEDDDFVSMENYDDSLTYDLVGAASEELELDAATILEGFGGYWVRYTGVEGYGHLLDSAGSSLPEFLVNLDQMHARVKLAFPDLKPPRFRVSEPNEAGLMLHYYSHRPGLAPLVVGLVKGLADRFGDVVEVEHIQMNTDGDEHDAFRVRYVSRGQGAPRS